MTIMICIQKFYSKKPMLIVRVQQQFITFFSMQFATLVFVVMITSLDRKHELSDDKVFNYETISRLDNSSI